MTHCSIYALIILSEERTDDNGKKHIHPFLRRNLEEVVDVLLEVEHKPLFKVIPKTLYSSSRLLMFFW